MAAKVERFTDCALLCASSAVPQEMTLELASANEQ